MRINIMNIQTNSEQKKTLRKFKTISAQIRFLNSQKFTRGEISKILSKHNNKLVRYQWVRNVLITEVKTPKES